ncbi:MAG: thioesterase family protein [Alphaproteobacteria bacterium]|nr:thioesterase family protein [Alphaproteobacteria bacterium]MCW5740296.1 thioesterase family protein [Alphaproteobacteria bacterium]
MTTLQSVHPFDRAIAVRRDADGISLADARTDYWAFVGQFGGITAATCLNALLCHPDAAGQPIALSVNFAAPIHEGALRLSLRRVRASRSTQHWSVEIHQGDDPQPRATATAVLAERRESWSHQPATPPSIPAAESLRELVLPDTVPWVSRYRFWFESGGPVRSQEPLSPPGTASSAYWLADAIEREVDVLSLTSMADTFFGRIFQVRGQIVPFGTVSLTTYFHSDAEELRSIATRRVVARADARRFHRSYSDQSGELWSPDGRLLATSHQIAYFKV